MAVSHAERPRCAGCGVFLRPRAELDDWDAEERAYHSEGDLEDLHECPPLEGTVRAGRPLRAWHAGSGRGPRRPSRRRICVSTSARARRHAFSVRGYGLDRCHLRPLRVVLHLVAYPE